MSSDNESTNNEYATQIEIMDVSNSRLTTEVMVDEQIPKLPTSLPPKKLIDAEEIPKKENLTDSEDMHEPRYTTTTTVVETTEYIADDGPTVHIGLPKADCSYIRTLGGIMKVVCIILCFLCFMMILFARASFPGANWATFVTSIGLSITTTLLLLYIFRVVDNLPQIPWIVMEMCYCFAWTIFFFIAASVLAAVVAQHSATGTYAFASFFAFGAMCAYGFDCYLKFLSWKNNEIATGGGVDFLEQQRRRAQNNEPTAGDNQEKPLEHIRDNLCDLTVKTSCIVARSLDRLERNSQRVLVNINKEIQEVQLKKKQIIQLEEKLKEENTWLHYAIQKLETFQQLKGKTERFSKKSQKKAVRSRAAKEIIQ